jgi:hypothetical protein
LDIRHFFKCPGELPGHFCERYSWVRFDCSSCPRRNGCDVFSLGQDRSTLPDMQIGKFVRPKTRFDPLGQKQLD